MSTRHAIPLFAIALGLGAIAGCDDAEVEDVAAPAPATVEEAVDEVEPEEAAGDVVEVAAPAPAAAAEAVDDDPAEGAGEPDQTAD